MIKIIYVEDNMDTAAAVKLILTSKGYEVDTAHNGTDGINMIQRNTYDLILLDVMLPDMSGWDIYAKIKSKAKAKYAFLSAIPISQERMEQLKREGVSDYITKPFMKADLISRIQRIIPIK